MQSKTHFSQLPPDHHAMPNHEKFKINLIKELMGVKFGISHNNLSIEQTKAIIHHLCCDWYDYVHVFI